MIRSICTMLCIGLGLFAPKGAYAQVLADFSSNITSGCSPILVQFSDQSTGNPTSWTWDLGNGTISTLQNPSTTYITPGSYTVILTVSDGTTTNTKTVTNYITAVPTPIVNFVANDSGFLCPPATIQFTDLSSMGIGGTATYLWDFGDGNTSNQANPAHTYNNMANYSVTLNVTNSAGCSKLLTKANYIQLIPTSVAGFSASATSACTAPFTTTFTSTSTGATSYFWDFGDGGTSTLANPTYTYNTTGSYTVTLVTSNPGDCKDTLVMPAYVYVGGVNASFTKSVTSTCIGSNVTFTNTSLPLGTTTWNFGDGNTSTAQTPTHAYTSAGTYTVKLVVTNGSCSDSTTQTIVVNNPPTSSFSATQTTGCSVPFTTQFNNTATGATSYLWNFGDGNTSTAANPSHTYTSFGSYTVTLTAYGPNGCQAVHTVPAYVKVSQATMTVSATPSTGCAPVTVNFTTSATTTIPVSSYTWNFGDGITATGTSTMTHTYTNPGTYNATVTFTTGTGCSFTSSTATVNAGTAPTAGFSFTPASPCPNQNVTFTNTSVGPPGTTYQWYFGDGGNSTQANPVYAYAASNTYTIMLIANSNGCKDTFQVPITVNPPKAQFAVTYSCTNRKQISFTNTSTGEEMYHVYYPIMNGKDIVGYKGAYTRNEQGKVVPYLTTKMDAPRGTILDLIASSGSGSGFVVDERGFIATNRHVASNWLTSFHFQDYAFPGLLLGYDNKGNLAIDPNVQVNRQDVGDWVPGNDKKYTGFNTYLDVTFANNAQRTPAKIVRISPTHDVAMIKIDLPETLPKAELYDNYDKIQPGDAAIVMGYPGIAPVQLVLKRSQDVFNTNPNITSVPVPTVSNGNVGRMVRGSEKNNRIDDYLSTFGDYYQLTINSTGGGNSGGPMFDDHGRVVGVFSAGKWEPGAAISFAVPIKYVMELMGRQEVIK